MILECRKCVFTVMASTEQPAGYQNALDAANAHEHEAGDEHRMIRQPDQARPHWDMRGRYPRRPIEIPRVHAGRTFTDREHHGDVNAQRGDNG